MEPPHGKRFTLLQANRDLRRQRTLCEGRIFFSRPEVLGLALNCEQVSRRFGRAADVFRAEACFEPLTEALGVLTDAETGAQQRPACARGVVRGSFFGPMELFLQHSAGVLQLTLDMTEVDKPELVRSFRNRDNRVVAKAGYVFPLTLSLTLFGGEWDLSSVKPHFSLRRGVGGGGSDLFCQVLEALLHQELAGREDQDGAPVVVTSLSSGFQTWREELIRRDGRFPFLIIIVDCDPQGG